MFIDLTKKHCLVGGLNPSEKYESVGIMLPNIWKNKKKFQTTNQSLFACLDISC